MGEKITKKTIKERNGEKITQEKSITRTPQRSFDNPQWVQLEAFAWQAIAQHSKLGKDVYEQLDKVPPEKYLGFASLVDKMSRNLIAMVAECRELGLWTKSGPEINMLELEQKRIIELRALAATDTTLEGRIMT